MTYTLQTEYTAVNYTAAADVPATWGYGPRTIDFITIHWWGNPVGQSLYSIIAWFCGLLPVVAPTSAHYVISGKVASYIVSIWDAAWHAGGITNGKHGNVCSVGLELDPKADNETYFTAAQVIADIWIEIGKIVPLKSHSYWTGTTCPGVYDLNRLYNIALDFYNNSEKETEDMPLTKADVDLILDTRIDKIGKDVNGNSGGTTSLREEIAYANSNRGWIVNEIRGIFKKGIKRLGGDRKGSETSLGEQLGWNDANVEEFRGKFNKLFELLKK